MIYGTNLFVHKFFIFIYTKKNIMKIDIKQGGKKFSVNFLIVPGKGDVHFSAMA